MLLPMGDSGNGANPQGNQFFRPPSFVSDVGSSSSYGSAMGNLMHAMINEEGHVQFGEFNDGEGMMPIAEDAMVDEDGNYIMDPDGVGPMSLQQAAAAAAAGDSGEETESVGDGEDVAWGDGGVAGAAAAQQEDGAAAGGGGGFFRCNRPRTPRLVA